MTRLHTLAVDDRGSLTLRSKTSKLLVLALLPLLPACGEHRPIPLTGFAAEPRVFRGVQTNSGPERYASWFGDSDGHILYFGLSPFYEAAWQCEAEGGQYCAMNDLKQPGDHLIGRFDLDRERFLDPLLVRKSDPQAPSSVWDVLVHSNGRIYYTTFWDEFGSVRPDGSDVRHYDGAGAGLNELWEGPGGEIYATRYLGSVSGADNETGAVVVFGEDGARRREFPFKKEGGVLICPKSLTVNPRNGEIWVNTDMSDVEGHPRGFDTFVLSPTGQIIDRVSYPPIAFLSFDADGRGWFVDNAAQHYALRIVEPDGRVTRFDLGAHGLIDTVQDIKHFGNRTLIATWALRVYVVERRPDGTYELQSLAVSDPPDQCPRGAAALGYTPALSSRMAVYESASCGIMVVRIGKAAR